MKVKIPTQLRQLAGGVAEVQVSGAATVKQLIEKLGADHPGLIERIVDEQGDIRRFVNVYVGDEDVRFLQGIDTPVEDSTTVSILPAVAGGGFGG
jgi:molybdopterin synthase sulfur carrier subunit